MFIKWGIVLLGIGMLSACVVVPTGPNVLVLPAPGKPFEAFQVDEAVCRQYAQYQLGVEPAGSSEPERCHQWRYRDGRWCGRWGTHWRWGWECWSRRGHWSRKWSRPRRCERRAGQWRLGGDPCNRAMTWRMSSVCTLKGIRCPVRP